MEKANIDLEKIKLRVEELFAAIRHGDAEHQEWLQKAILDHFAGRPVERPRGMGNKERAETAEARIVELENDLKNSYQKGREYIREPLIIEEEGT